MPYFIDRRPPLSEHPLYYHLRALLAVSVEQFSTDSVRQLLKSDLLSLPPADADQIEKHSTWRSASASTISHPPQPQPIASR